MAYDEELHIDEEKVRTKLWYLHALEEDLERLRRCIGCQIKGDVSRVKDIIVEIQRDLAEGEALKQDLLDEIQKLEDEIHRSVNVDSHWIEFVNNIREA